jgi:alanine dehydrogenase
MEKNDHRDTEGDQGRREQGFHDTAGVHALVSAGHHILLAQGGGGTSGLADDEYAREGAEIVESRRTVYARSDMIVKVKEPLDTELSLLQEGQILFTYLHLASSEKLTKGLAKER